MKELRLRAISTPDAANAYLPAFRADYNRRFGREPLSLHDAHRPLRDDEDLDLINRRTLSTRHFYFAQNPTFLLCVDMAGESPRFGGPFAPAGSALTAIGSAGESALRVSARGESRQLTRPRDAASHPEQPSHQVTSQQTVPTIRQKIDTPSRTWLPFSPLRQYTPEPHQLPLARHCSTMRRSAVLKRGRHGDDTRSVVHAPC